MMDIDIKLSVADGRRRFDLAAKFTADVPFAALYGPSGSGKTLTLQAIAGLLRPSKGHIRLGGRTLFDAQRGINLPAPDRRIGYLFQHYALFPHLSVRENIAFGLKSWCHRRLSATENDHVQALLDSFGLAATANSRPETLSGGQQQRVALARALACQPQVLLLDEPFAALHPALRHDLRRELAGALKQWAIPALMVTHNLDDVMALADIALVYGDGQVVQEINLRSATCRDTALQELAGHTNLAPTGLQQKIRQLFERGAEKEPPKVTDKVAAKVTTGVLRVG